MKNKNKIKEGALDVGIQSYPTTSSQTSSPTSASKTNGANINIKKKDLADPNVQKDLSKMKGANVNVVESGAEEPKSFKYLSEVKDAETGEISKPFTINGKKYPEISAWDNLPSKLYPVVSLRHPGRSRIQPHLKNV